ncbi:hypothetical protein [Bradyrhizobium sp. DASA03120]|uniref:hypothetical protein n=1 Tax=Bradyrhizobium sp. SMVTL-02 TaxID=3395917 RepID=UPI003F7068E0
MEVRLSSSELISAAMVGVVRRVTSIQRGHNKSKHAEKSDWQTDIDGAAAEMAVAKALGTYWEATNQSFKNPDLLNLQIRSTNWCDGHLIIRPNDSESERFVFVVASPPLYRIMGWITGRDARVEKFWREDKNGWWVPASELHGFSTLGIASVDEQVNGI